MRRHRRFPRWSRGAPSRPSAGTARSRSPSAAAGSYFLTRDLTLFFPTNNAIAVNANDVTLDLNGFSVTGVGTGTWSGIITQDGTDRITIENGTVQGWTDGIAAGGSDEVRVQNVTAQLNKAQGVAVGSGSTLSHVMAVGNVGDGILVSDPHSKYEGGLIEDSVATRNLYGIIVEANNVTITRNVIDSNSVTGIDIEVGAFGYVTDNTVQGTDSESCIHVRPGTSSNTIARNVVGNCASTAIFDEGSGDRIGPATSNLTSTQPWSNVVY